MNVAMITRTTQGRAPRRDVTGLAALTSPEAGDLATAGRCSRSRSAPLNSTARTCRCPPTPISPSRSAPGWRGPGGRPGRAAAGLAPAVSTRFPGTCRSEPRPWNCCWLSCAGHPPAFSGALLVSTTGATPRRYGGPRGGCGPSPGRSWRGCPPGRVTPTPGGPSSLELALAPGRVRPGRASPQHPRLTGSCPSWAAPACAWSARTVCSASRPRLRRRGRGAARQAHRRPVRHGGRMGGEADIMTDPRCRPP